MKLQKINEELLDLILKISQTSIAISLILFLLQYNWLEFYYSSLGVGWVTRVLTWNQVILSATPYGAVFFFALIILAIPLKDRTLQHKAFLLFTVYACSTGYVVATKGEIYGASLVISSAIFSLLYLALIISIAGLFFNQEQKEFIGSTQSVALFLCLIFLYTPIFATQVAEHKKENINEYYPELVEPGNFSSKSEIRLIGPAGDKFLLAIKTDKDFKYRIASDISKYNIKETKYPSLLGSLILPK